MTQNFLGLATAKNASHFISSVTVIRSEGFSLWSLNRSWRTFPGARPANDQGLKFVSACAPNVDVVRNV